MGSDRGSLAVAFSFPQLRLLQNRKGMLSRRKCLMAAAAVPLTAVLGGCAHPQLLDFGLQESDVRAKLGEPDSRTVLEDGTVRLVYSHQPMGQEVWWLFFDRDGRYVKLESAMNEEHFALAEAGKTTEAQVRLLFGKCAQEYDFRLLDQTALMYRFEDDSRRAMAVWFQFDRSGILTEWAVTDDPWVRDRLKFF